MFRLALLLLGLCVALPAVSAVLDQLEQSQPDTPNSEQDDDDSPDDFAEHSAVSLTRPLAPALSAPEADRNWTDAPAKRRLRPPRSA